MTVDKDETAASDAAQRAILRTQSGYIARLVGEKSELIAQLEGVQAERDEAIRERDEALEACIAVGRARDAWKARADAAMKARHNVTRERDEALEASALFQRDVHKWRTRAEAAETRIAPAVTKAEIEKVIRGQWGGCFDGLTDAVWSLVSGDDPAVFVVRESDIAAVKVERDEGGGWEANGDFIAMRQNTAEALRGWSLGELQMLARYEAVARAIEVWRDPVDNPVEDKARELYESVNPGVSWDAMVESAGRGNRADGKVAREYRVIARHVLGQGVVR